jgi:hypothetical protein
MDILSNSSIHSANEIFSASSGRRASIAVAPRRNSVVAGVMSLFSHRGHSSATLPLHFDIETDFEIDNEQHGS